jgi:hypothetical protein
MWPRERAFRALRSSCVEAGREVHLFDYRIMDMRQRYDKRQSVTAVRLVKNVTARAASRDKNIP